MYMGGKLQTYDCNWSLIWFTWAKIIIYLSLFESWKVPLKTRNIAVKLTNSFWIRIFVFGKRWMYIHMIYSWYFNYVVECNFTYMYLHIYVIWSSVWLVWLNSSQCLLTSCSDWSWNILRLCTRIRYEKVLYFVVHACLNMFIMVVGSRFGSLAWLCVKFVQE